MHRSPTPTPTPTVGIASLQAWAELKWRGMGMASTLPCEAFMSACYPRKASQRLRLEHFLKAKPDANMSVFFLFVSHAKCRRTKKLHRINATRFVTAPGSSAALRRTHPAMGPQPPKHKSDVPSGVDVSVPDCSAVFALPDSIQSRAFAALLSVVFSSNWTEVPTHTLRYHPPIPSTSIHPPKLTSA